MFSLQRQTGPEPSLNCTKGEEDVGFEILLGECKSCDWLIALLNRFRVAVRWLDGIKH